MADGSTDDAEAAVREVRDSLDASDEPTSVSGAVGPAHAPQSPPVDAGVGVSNGGSGGAEADITLITQSGRVTELAPAVHPPAAPPMRHGVDYGMPPASGAALPDVPATPHFETLLAYIDADDGEKVAEAMQRWAVAAGLLPFVVKAVNQWVRQAESSRTIFDRHMLPPQQAPLVTQAAMSVVADDDTGAGETKAGEAGDDETGSAASQANVALAVGARTKLQDPDALFAEEPGYERMSPKQSWELERAVCGTAPWHPGVVRHAARGQRKKALMALLSGFLIKVWVPTPPGANSLDDDSDGDDARSVADAPDGTTGQWAKVMVNPACPHARLPRALHRDSRDLKGWVDVSGPDLLSEVVVRWGDVEVVKKLIDYRQGVRLLKPLTHVERGLVNKLALNETEDGRTVLHNIAMKPHERPGAASAMISALTRSQVNRFDDEQNSPLHYAAFMGHAKISGALLRQSADVQAPNEFGETPLHLAFAGGHKGVASLLLQAGARSDALDKDGRTPLHRAFKMASAVGSNVYRVVTLMEAVESFVEALVKALTIKSYNEIKGNEVSAKEIEDAIDRAFTKWAEVMVALRASYREPKPSSDGAGGGGGGDGDADDGKSGNARQLDGWSTLEEIDTAYNFAAESRDVVGMALATSHRWIAETSRECREHAVYLFTHVMNRFFPKSYGSDAADRAKARAQRGAAGADDADSHLDSESDRGEPDAAAASTSATTTAAGAAARGRLGERPSALAALGDSAKERATKALPYRKFHSRLNLMDDRSYGETFGNVSRYLVAGMNPHSDQGRLKDPARMDHPLDPNLDLDDRPLMVFLFRTALHVARDGVENRKRNLDWARRYNELLMMQPMTPSHNSHGADKEHDLVSQVSDVDGDDDAGARAGGGGGGGGGGGARKRVKKTTERFFAYSSDSSDDDEQGLGPAGRAEHVPRTRGPRGMNPKVRRAVRRFREHVRRLREHEHGYHLIIDTSLHRDEASVDDLDATDLSGEPVFTMEERLRWFDRVHTTLRTIASTPGADAPNHPAFQDKRTQAAVQTKWDQHLRVKLILKLLQWVFFISCLLVIAVAQTGRDSWYPRYFQVNLENALVNEPWGDDFHEVYLDIGTVDDYWQWLEKAFSAKVFEPPGVHRDGGVLEQNPMAEGHVSTYNYFVGRPRLRVVRTKAVTCFDPPLVDVFETAVCYSLFENAEIDTAPFAVGTGADMLNFTFADRDVPRYRGAVDVYPGYGYSVVIPDDQAQWATMRDFLRDNSFIDMNTRVAMVELTVYNPSHNLFGLARLGVEFDAAGGAVPTYVIDTLKLIQYVTTDDILRMVLEIFSVLLMLYYIWQEVVEMTTPWPAPPGLLDQGETNRWCGRKTKYTRRKSRQVAPDPAKGAGSSDDLRTASVNASGGGGKAGSQDDTTNEFLLSQFEVPTFKVYYPSLQPAANPDLRSPPLFVVPGCWFRRDSPCCCCCYSCFHSRRNRRGGGARGPGGAARDNSGPLRRTSARYTSAKTGLPEQSYYKGLAREVDPADETITQKSLLSKCFRRSDIEVYLTPVVEDEEPVEYVVPMYLHDSFNWLDILLLCCYVIVVTLHFTAVIQAWDIPWNERAAFVDTFTVAEIVQWKAYLLGIAFALGCFKALEYMRVSSALSTFILVIQGMLKRLTSFFVIFFFCLIAFAGFEYAAFGLQTEDAATISLSILRQFSASLGEADFSRTFHLNQWLTPVAVFLFAIFVVILLLNLLISVMSEAYEEVKESASAIWCYTQFRMLMNAEQKTDTINMLRKKQRALVKEAKNLHGRLGLTGVLSAVSRRASHSKPAAGER